MKLFLQRQQEIKTNRRGQSEGGLFTLTCHVDLDAHERQLVDTYAEGNYPVAFIKTEDVRDFHPSHMEDHVIRLPQLVGGWSISTEFVGDAHRAEQVILEGCTSFKTALLAEESYRGQEEIDI